MIYNSRSSKSINKLNDKLNYNDESFFSKYINAPKQNKNHLCFSPKNKRNSKYNSSININNLNVSLIQKSINIQEKVEQYHLHPFRRVNLKIVGEGIKQRLIEMNRENLLETEKTMSSPGHSRQMSTIFKEKYNIGKNLILPSRNSSKLFLPFKSSNIDDNKIKSAVHSPNLEISENKNNSNIIKNEKIIKSSNNIINSKPINKENADNNNFIEIENKEYNQNMNDISIKSKISKKNLDEKHRKLNKIKILYDSLDDHESEDDNDEDDVINPETKFIFFFDLLIMLFYLYTFLIITLNIATSKCFCPIDNKFTFNDILFYFNDLLYILDLFISFSRCYYNFEYKLIKKSSLIIKNYLTGDFFFDLLEAIPVFTINKYICFSKNNSYYINCFIYEIPSILIFLKMTSILKIIKINKIINSKKNQALNNFFELISENYTLERTTELIINSLFFLGIIHCFVCFHIFIGKHSFSNWLVLTKSENESLFFIYIESLYFLVTTLTTVGYGDITCQSFEERIFQIILLAVGSIFYSYIISTIGNFIKNDSHAKIKYNDDLNILENIRIAYPNMPFKLYRNINKYLESKSNSQEKYDINLLIDTLPFTLKNTILFTMYKSVIKNFKFFKKNDNSEFISRILSNFISIVSKKNDFLIYEGEMVEEIIFIKDGRISLNAAINLEDPSKSINKYFYENFKAFTSDEEMKLFGSRIDGNLNYTGYVSTMNTSITYDTAKNKINNAFKTLKSEKYNDEKSVLHLNKEEEKSDLNDLCKFDINGGAIKNEDGSYQYLKILDIRKNEHFGCVFMTLKKPCPLTLQVKSKFAELYFLKKEEAISTSKSYPNIWKKLYGKEFHNLRSIKDLTFKALRKYIEVNQLLINLNLDDAIITNDITLNDLNTLEKSIYKERSFALYNQKKKSISHKILSPKNNDITRFKTMNNEFDKKSKRLSLGVIVVQKDKKNFKKKFIRNQSNSIIYNSINKEKILQLANAQITSNKKNKQKSVYFKDNIEINNDKNENINENSDLLINQKKYLNEIQTIKEENESENSPIKNQKISKKNKLKKLKSFLLNLKKKFKIKKYNESELLARKSYPKPIKSCLKNKNANKRNSETKLRGNLRNINPLINSKTIDSNSHKENKIGNSINEFNIDNSIIKDLENFCDEETNFSFCSLNEKNNFNLTDLSISKNINIEILSSYANLNEISKGKYLFDVNFQNDIKLYLKKHFYCDSLNDISLSLKSIEFPSEKEYIFKQYIKDKRKDLKKTNKTDFTLNEESPKKKRKKNQNKKVFKKNLDLNYQYKETSKSQKLLDKLNKETKIQSTSQQKYSYKSDKKNILNISLEKKSGYKKKVKNNILENDLNKKNITFFPSFNNLNQINQNDDNSNKSYNNNSSSFSKKSNKKKLFNINIKKEKHVYSKYETEFEIDKTVNVNTLIIGKEPIYNEDNNINNNYNNYNNIYKEKNHHLKKKYGNNKNKRKSSPKIINQIFPQTNIITNNITTITSNNNEHNEIFNSNEKINNIESSFNINNHIQNNQNKNSNIINNEEKTSQNNLLRDFCQIY